MGEAHMVTIGTGRDDPRQWVQAAYLILDGMDSTGRQGKLPSRAEIAVRAGVREMTVQRAYRELTGMGLICHVPGLGYYGAGGK